MAVLLAAGDTRLLWRDGLRSAKPGMAQGLQRWAKDQLIQHQLHTQRSINLGAALREAMRVATGSLPIFVICGALAPVILAPAQDAWAADSGASASVTITEQVLQAQQEQACHQVRCCTCSYCARCLHQLWLLVSASGVTCKLWQIVAALPAL